MADTTPKDPWQNLAVLKKQITSDQVNASTNAFSDLASNTYPLKSDKVQEWVAKRTAARGDNPQPPEFDSFRADFKIEKPNAKQLNALQNPDGSETVISEEARNYNAVKEAFDDMIRVKQSFTRQEASTNQALQQSTYNYNLKLMPDLGLTDNQNNNQNILLSALEQDVETQGPNRCIFNKTSDTHWDVMIPFRGKNIEGNLAQTLHRLSAAQGKTIVFTLPDKWMPPEKQMRIAKIITESTINRILKAPIGVKPTIVKVKNNPYLAKNPEVARVFKEMLEHSQNQNWFSESGHHGRLSAEDIAVLKEAGLLAQDNVDYTHAASNTTQGRGASGSNTTGTDARALHNPVYDSTAQHNSVKVLADGVESDLDEVHNAAKHANSGRNVDSDTGDRSHNASLRGSSHDSSLGSPTP